MFNQKQSWAVRLERTAVLHCRHAMVQMLVNGFQPCWDRGSKQVAALSIHSSKKRAIPVCSPATASPDKTLAACPRCSFADAQMRASKPAEMLAPPLCVSAPRAKRAAGDWHLHNTSFNIYTLRAFCPVDPLRLCLLWSVPRHGMASGFGACFMCSLPVPRAGQKNAASNLKVSILRQVDMLAGHHLASQALVL